MMTGVVIRSTGSWFTVRTEDGAVYDCKLRGRFRIKGIKSTSPVAVGDRVDFTYDSGKKIGVIQKILPRNNYIVRKATKLSKLSHIIAANIDTAMVIATVAYPRTSPGFIDRFLVTAEAYHIPAVIVFNKTDIYDEEMKQRFDELASIYRGAGYECLAVSALTGDNIELLKERLKEKTTLLSGHSGVGKSAIINAIQPHLKLKTAKISEKYKKGMHTTTFAEMFPLTFGGYIIDTPGIKEFALVDFDRREIAERFPEMRKYMHGCRFNNCIHVHEPGCAVKEAVEKGEISMTRYESYLSILNDDYWEETEKDFRPA